MGEPCALELSYRASAAVVVVVVVVLVVILMRPPSNYGRWAYRVSGTVASPSWDETAFTYSGNSALDDCTTASSCASPQQTKATSFPKSLPRNV